MSEEIRMDRGSSRATGSRCNCINYLCAGLEQSSPDPDQSIRFHVQGFIQLCKKAVLSTARAKVNRLFTCTNAYLAPGDNHVNLMTKYCMKEGSYFQIGHKRVTGTNRHGPPKKKSLLADIIKDHESKIPLKDMYLKYPNDLQDVGACTKFRHVQRKLKPNVLYLYGDTGIGKSENILRALRKAKVTYYIKPSGEKWFPGYDQQEVCVIEEFAGAFPCNVFLQLCDRAPFQVEAKGEHIEFNSPWIIITSNIEPEKQCSRG